MTATATTSNAREAARPRKGRTAGKHLAIAVPPHDSVMTVDEFCAAMKVSKDTFYHWRKVGTAPVCHRLPNGELRISHSDRDQRFFPGFFVGVFFAATAGVLLTGTVAAERAARSARMAATALTSVPRPAASVPMAVTAIHASPLLPPCEDELRKGVVTSTSNSKAVIAPSSAVILRRRRARRFHTAAASPSVGSITKKP